MEIMEWEWKCGRHRAMGPGIHLRLEGPTSFLNEQDEGYLPRRPLSLWGFHFSTTAICCRFWLNGIPMETSDHHQPGTWSFGWIPGPSASLSLRGAGVAEPRRSRAELVEDIIACPGTDTCGLGITPSKGLARGLAEVFPAGQVPEDCVTLGISKKSAVAAITPAPNTISATIGLHGVGKRLESTRRTITNCISVGHVKQCPRSVR